MLESAFKDFNTYNNLDRHVSVISEAILKLKRLISLKNK